MNRDWIGLAEDLTTAGVVGRPYPEPVPEPRAAVTAAYPSPPRHGGLKTLLAVGALSGIVLCLAFLTPPGQYAWHVVKSELFGSEKSHSLPSPIHAAVTADPPVTPVKPEASQVGASSAATLPDSVTPAPPSTVAAKKPAAPKRTKTTARSEATRVGDASPGETAREAPAGTEVDLEKYRRLTRGL